MAGTDLKPTLIPFLDAIKSISICRNTALRHIEIGLMPPLIKLGSKIYFAADVWEAWIKSGCLPVNKANKPKSQRKSKKGSEGSV